MGYKITDKAKENPNLFPSPLNPRELIGVGGKYFVNETAQCPTCSPEDRLTWEKEQASKERRFYREAEPHEYEALAEQYKASGGIPQYLIYIPDEPKATAVTEKK